MNGSAYVTPVMFADGTLIFCFIASATFVFLKHESWIRDDKVAGFVARTCFWLVPALIVFTAPVINENIFRFGGLSGLAVSTLLSLGLFCAAPAWATEWLCKKHLHRRAVRVE